jgi:hypothetical protein
MADDAMPREALRLYRRYQHEIVEAFKLCPWAERARLDGRTAERVVPASDPGPAAILEVIDELEADERVEVGLLLFPRVSLGRPAFERFVAGIVRDEAARRADRAATFAMAAFHPEAAPDLGHPERLIPFLRRTPDPTIQLVRMSALERVRTGPYEGTQFIDITRLASAGLTAEDTLPLRERIARANLRSVRRAGVEELEARFASIRRDRDATYRAIAANGH